MKCVNGDFGTAQLFLGIVREVLLTLSKTYNGAYLRKQLKAEGC